MQKLLIILLFTIASTSSFAQCVIKDSLVIDPPPDSCYFPGTKVNFKFIVDGYDTIGQNWLDGISLNYGKNWDINSIIPDLAGNSASGQGKWRFYNSYANSGYNKHFNKGFYYDLYADSDIDPANDFGDWCVNQTCLWTFSWSVTVDSNAAPGAMLIDTIIVFGDQGPPKFCADTFIFQTRVCSQITGTSIPNSKNHFNIYNSGNELVIENKSKDMSPAKVTVTDLLSRQLFQTSGSLQPGTNHFDVPFSHYPPGIYIAAVDVGGHIFTKKLIF